MKLPNLRPDQELKKSIDEFLSTIDAFHTSTANEINPQDFYLIHSKIQPSSAYTFNLTDPDNHSFDLYFIQYSSQYHIARKTGGRIITETHVYTFGYLKLQQDYGVALIRPETWEDKLSELFKNEEVKFKNRPRLNKRFYILAKEENHFKNALPEEFLTYMENLKGFSIEFHHHQCLFRLPKAFNQEEAAQICKIGFDLDQILNK